MQEAATRIQSILDQEFEPDPMRTFYIHHNDFPREPEEAQYEARSPEEALRHFFEDRIPSHFDREGYYAYNRAYTEGKA